MDAFISLPKNDFLPHCISDTFDPEGIAIAALLESIGETIVKAGPEGGSSWVANCASGISVYYNGYCASN